MAGPFPGMDPFLETPAGWRGVHGLLLARAVAALNRALPEGFIARLEERGYVVPRQRDIVPDVTVRRTRPVAVPAVAAAPVRTPDPPTGVAVLPPEERRERYIEVVDLRRGGQVVKVIELLSPANKAPGNPGRVSYLKKQGELLESDTSLLEIDLLRAGLHTVAVPHPHLAAAGPAWDYFVCLHRATRPDEYPYWLSGVRDPLPVVPVPLTDDHPDAPLDIGAALEGAYEDGAYAREIDYAAEPDPPLAPEIRDWADALLRGKGLR